LCRSKLADLKIFDALRIKMYFATVIPCEPFKQFRKRALRAMAPVDKR